MKIVYYIYIIVTLIMFSCTSKPKSLLQNDFVNNYKFNSEIRKVLERDSIEPDYQNAATSFSEKGDHKNALLQWDKQLMFKPKVETYAKEIIDSINNKYDVVSAREYIIEESDKNKVIIINELHHNASHRVFTESLLHSLFTKGYKNLCLEALNKGYQEDTLLNKRKYPVQSTGYYVKNPQFGDLIRTALQIGYKLIPYETTKNIGGGEREKDQAKNITKVIESHPDEKFIIHCGSGHALEGNVKFFGGLALAERVHKLTGINPLTIDQVYYSEKSKNNYRSPIFKAFNIGEPSILLDSDNFPFSYKRGDSWMDIVVFHPNTEYINGRPNWLIQNDRELIQIELNNIDFDFPVMVMAFNSNENIKQAIPVDILEVENNEKANLVLKKGKYNIVVINQIGKVQVFEKVVE